MCLNRSAIISQFVLRQIQDIEYAYVVVQNLYATYKYVVHILSVLSTQ